MNNVASHNKSTQPNKRKTSLENMIEGQNDTHSIVQDATRPVKYNTKIRRKNIITESASNTLPKHKIFSQPTPKNAETRTFLLKYLRECFLFQSLSKAAINEIVNVMRIRVLQPNEVVFKEGDPGCFFYFIEKGRLNVFKKTNENIDPPSETKEKVPTISDSSLHTSKSQPGSPPLSLRVSVSDEIRELGENRSPIFDFDMTDQIKIRTYGKGEWFGELSLLYQPRRAASIIAETETVCWLLDRQTFKHMCQSNWESNFETTTTALKAVPLLQALSDEQLKDVAQVSRFEEYNSGDVIVR